MEQGLPARVPVQAGVWVEEKAKVEAGWADHLPQGREELASAQNAVTKNLMLQDNLVI